MRILLYGSHGWIGTKLRTLLEREHTVIAGTARVDETSAMEAELDQEMPERVVCCIGRTHGPGCGTIDYLEDRLAENVQDNLFAPISLALACQRRHLHLTYLGTGCIFEFEDDKTEFDEDSLPNFFGSGYSIVKGFTDRLMRQLPALNVRIRMPITDENHPRNFITKITSYDHICSISNSMTVLDDLLPCMADLCVRGTLGTVNLCNPGAMSHNDILTLYRDLVDPSFTWQNFDIKEQDRLLAAKRSNNHMRTDRLQQLCPGVPTLPQAVAAALRRMAERTTSV